MLETLSMVGSRTTVSQFIQAIGRYIWEQTAKCGLLPFHLLAANSHPFYSSYIAANKVFMRCKQQVIMHVACKL